MDLSKLRDQDDKIVRAVESWPRSMKFRALQYLATELQVRITALDLSEEVIKAFKKEQQQG